MRLEGEAELGAVGHAASGGLVADDAQVWTTSRACTSISMAPKRQRTVASAMCEPLAASVKMVLMAARSVMELTTPQTGALISQAKLKPRSC